MPKLLEVAAAAALLSSGIAQASPAASIDCAVQAMPAKQRAALGASLVNDNGAMEAAQQAIAGPAAACARAGKWSTARTDAAVAWTTWKLMADDLQRESGLADADAAILRAYVDEDPARVEGLDRFGPAQLTQLIATLRGRGAHLHDGGRDSERELAFLLMAKEMKAQAADFTAAE